MVDKPYLFIVNPKSGAYHSRDLPDLIRFIENKMSDLGKVAQVVVTEGPGHASEITGRALRNENWAAIVAVGGDGTVNEVARHLVYRQVPLGILPLGSGNGLARHLHIPMKPGAAMVRLTEGTPVSIDSASINEIPYFCTAGLGFDAEVSRRFSQNTGRGFKNYVRIALDTYRDYAPRALEINGETFEFFLLTVANAGQFGNNAWIAPGASVTDGLLDVCHIKPFPEWYGVVLGAKLFTKAVDESEYIAFRKVRELCIRTESPLWAHYDGEPLCTESEEIFFRVFPASLNVLC